MLGSSFQGLAMRETDSLVESELSDGGLEQLSYLLIEAAIAATCFTEYQSDPEVSDGAFTRLGTASQRSRKAALRPRWK